MFSNDVFPAPEAPRIAVTSPPGQYPLRFRRIYRETMMIFSNSIPPLLSTTEYSMFLNAMSTTFFNPRLLLLKPVSLSFPYSSYGCILA